MRVTRRHLQVTLGALWLLDAALQCQPVMFSGAFASKILSPAGDGQPSIVAEAVHWAATLASASPVLANTGIVLIQIALGVGILSHRFTRIALAASIAWALVIWLLGEGLGGIVAGATLLTGAPGAALLYAVIAILAWPTAAHQGDCPPSRLALPAWCALWLLGAGLQLAAGNNSGTSFTMMLRTAQYGAPGWLGAIDRHALRLQLPFWVAACVVAVYVLVATWSLVPGRTRDLSVGLGVAIALTGWILFQGLGDPTSGHATDPNSGPLIVLLALAVVGATHPRETTASSRGNHGSSSTPAVLASLSPPSRGVVPLHQPWSEPTHTVPESGQ